MDNRIYLSVLSPAASSGEIELTLQTYNAIADVTIVMTVTGVPAGASEKTVAQKIYDQTKIMIAQAGATYDHAPGSVISIPEAQFQTTRTDQVVCVWSQAQFSLEVTEDSTGATISIRTNPGLLVTSDFLRYGAAANQDYSDYTTDELAALIELLSDEIVSTLRNNIVLSTYVVDTWCNMTDAIQLPASPVVSMDSPIVKMPFVVYSLISADAFLDVTDRYIVQSDGWVNYRNAQTLLNDCDNPFDIHNQWRVTWVAGYFQIPTSIKLAMVKMSPFYTSYSPYEELAGGTSRAKFKDSDKEKKSIFQSLSGYML